MTCETEESCRGEIGRWGWCRRRCGDRGAAWIAVGLKGLDGIRGLIKVGLQDAAMVFGEDDGVALVLAQVAEWKSGFRGCDDATSLLLGGTTLTLFEKARSR